MNYFAVGQAICTQVSAAMPELRAVRLAASLQEIADWQPASPAVWVVWDGDAISDSAGQGQAQLIKQRWIVALVVRSVKDSSSGAGVIEAAGDLLDTLLTTLMGFKPNSPVGCRALLRIDAPKPGYGVGYGFFPLAFEAVFSKRSI